MNALGVPLAVMMLAAQGAAASAPANQPASANQTGVPQASPAEAVYGPKYDPRRPKPKPVAVAAPDACQNRQEKQGDIVICAQRPQGYRLNPDVMEARREIRSGGRPHRPENFKTNDCASVGPMGCRGGPTINLIAAALTAATMASRIIKGEEIGSMFKTTPEPTEYDLYVEAKHRREAKEAEAAAKARAAQAAKPAAPAAPDAIKPTESDTHPR